MVLGTYSREDRLYAAGYSLTGSGDLKDQLSKAIERLPQVVPPVQQLPPVDPPPQAQAQPAASQQPAFVPPPPEQNLSEGSLFIAADRTIHQIADGQPTPVEYGGVLLKADGSLVGRRLAALLLLRDRARRVLQSQNDGWPEEHRVAARRALNYAYDDFLRAYGPINKTTFGADARRNRHPPDAEPGRQVPGRPGRHARHVAGRV